MDLDLDSDLDLAIFVVDNFKKNSALLLEGAFTSFFKDKMSKRSHKTVGIKVFSYYFCLVIE